MGTAGTEGQDQLDGTMAGPSVSYSVPLPPLSLLVLAPPFPQRASSSLLLPAPHSSPTGSPELRPEETLPKAEGSWTEGDEVRLVCSARGYPEPKLKWSQAGGHVRAPPVPSELSGTQVPGGPCPITDPNTAPPLLLTGGLDITSAFTPALDPMGSGLIRSLHSQQSQPLEARAG